MKKFRKLIPALALLIVSAVLMSTASYAWFSMNTQVTANGLQVKAKSNSVYLLISNTPASIGSAALIQAENSGNGFTSVSETSSSSVYPSALIDKATAGGTVKGTVTDYSDPTQWYTARALTAAASTVNSSSEVILSSGNFSDYVLKYTYSFTLAKGSNDATNLKVVTVKVSSDNTATGANPTDAPISILVVNRADQAHEEFKLQGQSKVSGGTDDGKYVLNGSVNLAASLSDSTTATFDVYVYYDGNNEQVYTNNIENLNGCTIEITFGVS